MLYPSRCLLHVGMTVCPGAGSVKNRKTCEVSGIIASHQGITLLTTIAK